MKRSLPFGWVLLTLVWTVWPACAPKPDDGAFVPHKPATIRLGGGLEVMALDDREFPTAQLFLYIRGGAVYDPPGKEGLTGIAMQTLRLGGADGRTPERLEEELEFVGASLEMGATAEYEYAALSLLTKDLDLGLDILFDLLKRPALLQNRFEIVKARAKDAVLREEEDPIRLAFREFPLLVYGPGSAWGRRPTVESIDLITLEDVKAFLRKAIVPGRILLAAAGDFSAKEIAAKIDARTRDWKIPEQEPSPIPRLEEKFEKKLVVIGRPELTQSSILMGHLGARRDNPDKYPLLVMNFILGGSGALTSRMGEEIRSTSGMAYSVWSDFGFGKDYGLFKAAAQTALDNTVWVAEKMVQMIRAAQRQADFTDGEVANAKSAILRSLIFDFETRFSQVKEQARFRLWGYPDDYIESFQKKIGSVTRSDVAKTAKYYLHPEGLKVLVVTDEKKAAQVREALAK